MCAFVTSVWAIIFVVISPLVLTYFCAAFAAEAVLSAADDIYQKERALPTSSPLILQRLSAYKENSHYNRLIEEALAQIDKTDELDRPTQPPQTKQALGHNVARDFTTATEFYLTSLTAFERGDSQLIRLAASDISTFLTLPEQPDELRYHHLAQQAFDEVYFLWPDRDYAPAEGLSYRFDMTAEARYQSAEFYDFTGTLSLSFQSREAVLALGNDRDSFSVHFDIAQFDDASIIQVIGRLYHNETDFDAPLIMGYSALPDAAFKGYITTLSPLPDTPHYVRFTNFTLPE